MKPSSPRSGLRWPQAVLLLLLMACAAVLAHRLMPRERLSALSEDVRLDNALPKSFRGWRLDERVLGGVVNPQQEALVRSLYSQTVSRIYVDAQGRRVMLSIAYGSAQDGGLELHRPEVCYVAQGFKLESAGRDFLKVDDATPPVPLQRLLSQQGTRHEPISYWMRVGDDLMVSGLSQQLSRVRHGLKGFIPDGVLFRVSSLSDDPQAAFAVQDRFVRDLLASTDARARRFLIGPVSQAAPPAAP